ncbi:hypothetical protein [Leifsonia sp. Root227]|uniref:hypothetical protein n=1 Tax=Leifsonia sp. Root227 TaxID=1736496 RepID=UPI0012F7DDCF|nr:hypothetical protein [Leifsonia sp. Root227]
MSATSFDLSWLSVPAGSAELDTVRRCVLVVASALERLTGDLSLARPGTGSKAQLALSSPANMETSTGTSHLADAQSAMFTATRAGADHVRAYGMNVLGGQTTVSNWTLARAALEAFGRAYSLLGSVEPTDLLSRYVALTKSEFRFARLTEFATRDGKKLDVEWYIAGLEAMARSAGAESATAPSATSMASTLIEDAAPGNGGRQRYSQLSSAAHGESVGVQMFIPEIHGGFTLPKVLVSQASFMVAAGGILLGDELVTYYEPPATVSAQWKRRRDRALNVVFEAAAAED